MCISNQERCGISKVQNIKSFANWTTAERYEIFAAGRPVPELPNLTQKTENYVRKFHTYYYDDTPWLCGCSAKNELFCWWCVLFSLKKRGAFIKPGFRNVQNIIKEVARHGKTADHIRAAQQYDKFSEEFLSVRQQLDKQARLADEAHNELVRENREILMILVDVVCTIGKQELGLRGHRESVESLNRGNYIELLKLVAKYSPRMKQHLLRVEEAQKQNKRVFSGLSPDIQNDLIQCVSAIMLAEIRKEVDTAYFISILGDETTDNSDKSQLSIVLRYVTDKGDVKERFITFIDLEAQRTASSLFKIFDSFITEWNIGPRLVSQGYDGAAVMSGHLNGLQKLVRDKYEMALFIHCACHILNLVLMDVLKYISRCRVFFANLDMFTTFFKNSPGRVHVCAQYIKNRFPEMIKVRWNYTGRLVNMVLANRSNLIEMYNYMIDQPEEFTGPTVSHAIGLRFHLADFKFMFQLLVHDKIFKHTDILFQTFQQRGVSVVTVQNRVNSTLTFLDGELQKFDEVYTEAEQDFYHKSVEELVRAFSGSLRQPFKESHKLAALILTLASTTVRVECSFSTLDRIKDYKRTTMVESRLNGLGLMTLEKEVLLLLESRTDFNELVVREFLRKPRMLELTFR